MLINLDLIVAYCFGLLLIGNFEKHVFPRTFKTRSAHSNDLSDSHSCFVHDCQLLSRAE